MTQDSVARQLGLDRAAISNLERGDRNLRVPELVALAEILARPLSYFVDPPVPAAVSRRATPHADHASTRALDVEIDQFAGDVRTLVNLGLLAPADHAPANRLPRGHVEAERAARDFRARAGLDGGPIQDLGRVCEHFGLFTFAAPLGQTGPDGACVEVSLVEGRTAAAAVVNGEADPGRRRMTLAHELGHWLFGDAYDIQALGDSEQMINSFAIHFLAPRAGVTRVWADFIDWPERDRALAVGVAFRLSWSATVSQLRNLDLIPHQERLRLASQEPRKGDYLRLGLSWTDELGAPYLSPGFIAACLAGYGSGSLTAARTLELLHGLLILGDLPDRDSDDSGLRRAFEGHGGLQP